METPAAAMLWLKMAAPPVRKPVPAPLAFAQPKAAKPKAAAQTARPAPPIEPAPPAGADVPTVAAAPATAPSAATILSIAKRDLGKIDRDLRTEFREPPRLSASVETALQKLARGIDQAHQAVPNKWYQAARIEDITPPGDDARKIYRIKTVLGTYCVRYKDKNRPGVDQGQANLGDALIGACPHMF